MMVRKFRSGSPRHIRMNPEQPKVIGERRRKGNGLLPPSSTLVLIKKEVS